MPVDPTPPKRPNAVRLVVIPPDPGRKQSHLALVTHRGGGWYDVRCMGQGASCKAGECKHTASMALVGGSGRSRRVRQVPAA